MSQEPESAPLFPIQQSNLMNSAAMTPYTCEANHFSSADETTGRLEVSTEAEQDAVLQEWDATDREFPRAKCLHELFEEQVRRTPEAIALVFRDQQLTYLQLNERANRLANELRRLGIGPDRCVGVCMLRSLEMVIALYAVHKAGGAYLPIDPPYPEDRIAFMIEDAQVPLILTQKALNGVVPQSDARRLFVDTGLDNIADGCGSSQEGFDFGNKANPENPAYVIYTSGSTGKPKGVMIRHRNVVNLLTGMDLAIGGDSGTWLAVTSISFDISVVEIFWTLTRGFKV